MLRFVRSWSAISRSLPQFAPAQRAHARRRFTLERLEERAMLSTIPLVVNMLPDDPSGPTTGQMTLRDAINTADGGATTNQYVITFKQGLTGTIDLTTSALPDLDNNIVIKGPGASKLTVHRDSSAAPFSIFKVDSGATVNISGVTISGGSGFGGIYNNLGTLTVIDSTITHNGSSTVWGGGIDNTGTLTVIGSTFTDNYAQVGGGLVNVYSTATATVIDSTFSNNSAFDGGGISNLGSKVTVVGSTFTNNIASFEGGGFEEEYNNGDVTVIGSTFINNFAGHQGGGIFTNGIMTVVGSTFIGNSAEYGGGLDNPGTLTVDGSIFINNSASFDGGGIYNYSGGTVTVTNSIFVGNSATDGGGIYNLGTLINTKNVFFHNTGGDIS